MPEAAELTGREGLLVFGDFSNLSNEEFHYKIDAVLGNINKLYLVTTSLNQTRSDYIDTTLEGTRYESDQSTSETGRVDNGRQGNSYADQLRYEASETLEAAIAAVRNNNDNSNDTGQRRTDQLTSQGSLLYRADSAGSIALTGGGWTRRSHLLKVRPSHPLHHQHLELRWRHGCIHFCTDNGRDVAFSATHSPPRHASVKGAADNRLGLVKVGMFLMRLGFSTLNLLKAGFNNMSGMAIRNKSPFETNNLSMTFPSPLTQQYEFGRTVGAVPDNGTLLVLLPEGLRNFRQYTNDKETRLTWPVI